VAEEWFVTLAKTLFRSKAAFAGVCIHKPLIYGCFYRLEILVQLQRDKAAAMRLLRKLLRRQGFVPTIIVTDKLRSYGAALRELGFSGLHEQGLRANNRAENSHQPVRRRERKM
jgi:transposase-like protein